MNQQWVNEENHLKEQLAKADQDVLEAIKAFVDDLSNVTTNADFVNYSYIVNHVTASKVKSALKLIAGFKRFFDHNTLQKSDSKDGSESGSDDSGSESGLNSGSENSDLKSSPSRGSHIGNISFDVADKSVSFNFEAVFSEAEQCDRSVIMDHLNHIRDLMKHPKVDPEEAYVDNLFSKVKAKMSADDSDDGSTESRSNRVVALSKDIFREVMTDSTFKTLNPSKVVKTMCLRLKNVLAKMTADSQKSEDGNFMPLSRCVSIIEAVENIDFVNFNPVQFIQFVQSLGVGFGGEELDVSSLFKAVSSLSLQDEPLGKQDALE